MQAAKWSTPKNVNKKGRHPDIHPWPFFEHLCFNRLMTTIIRAMLACCSVIQFTFGVWNLKLLLRLALNDVQEQI